MASAVSLEPLEIIHKRIFRIITKHSNFTSYDIITIEIAKKMFMYDKNPEVPVHHSLQHIKKNEQTHNYSYTSLAARCN